MVIRNQKFRIRGFYYVLAYIPHALSALSFFLATTWNGPIPRGLCTDPNVDSRRGPHCALLDRAAWSEPPPSRGDE
ncbi:hypothetical protein CRG98_021287 [Punica granatum]|uniref:Uncharacterized protein n=1 Tax=Punica granatum TaxID=22663 RepID=A0A2I0JQX6_PUNGR|nr:hypothetical protein CRG98_021287 [Punica granatum]